MREMTSFFKVCADESRLAMLWLLLHRDELCVCDFMEVLNITQSKASRHLRVLYNAGLVADRREGLWRYYALRPARDAFVKAQLPGLRRALAGSPDAAALLRRLTAVVRKRERGKPCCP